MKTSIPALIILAIAILASGCATKTAAPSTPVSAGITIEHAWARPSSQMASGGMGGMENLTSAAYFTIRNDGPADRLTDATGDIARSVEIHETKMDGGMAKMERLTGIDIPANGSVELKPGGYHIMLIQPVRELKAGDTFSITLVFEKAGRKQVPVTVQVPS